MNNPLDDIPVQLADTITAALNTQFDGDFVALRRMLPEHDVKELNTLRVFVIPGGLDGSEIMSDETVENDWLVGIAFQRNVRRASDGDATDILRLVKRVRRYLQANRMIDLGEPAGEYAIIDIAHNPYVDQELLLQGQFFSAIELGIRDYEEVQS